jgi:hypothetical protein
VDLSERGFAEAHRAGHLLKAELDANLRPIRHDYLGDPIEIRKAEQAVVEQRQAQKAWGRLWPSRRL